MSKSKEELNFDWVLKELEGVAEDEISKSIELLITRESHDVYGVVLVNAHSLEFRFQTKEGLRKCVEKYGDGACEDKAPFESMLRWDINSFSVADYAPLKRTKSILDKLLDRLYELEMDALDNSGHETFSKISELQESIQKKIENYLICSLKSAFNRVVKEPRHEDCWPLAFSYAGYNVDQNQLFSNMELVSEQRVVDFYKGLGERRLMDLLSLPIKEQINNQINTLGDQLYEESKLAFEKIIKDYGDEGLYWLCLYHNGDCTGYITVSFSTEKGLDQVGAQYARHSEMDLESNRKMLRWSPCDSPYHCEFEEALNKTESLLSNIEEVIDDAEEDFLERLCLEYGNDLFYELHREISEKIHQEIIKQLARIKESPIVAEYIAQSGCVLWVTAGDTNHDAIEDIAKIHGLEVAEKVAEEMEEAHKISSIDYDLKSESIEKEELNPTQPSFSQSDFDSIVEAFNPTFYEKGGCVFAEDLGELRHYMGNTQAESGHNSYCLMTLLSSSPHYQELDKLYGHFMGVEFSPNDFLPVLARRFVRKLEEKLANEFPDKSFITYLEVSRNSRSRFHFYQNRQDGFAASFKSELIDEGVREYRAIGKLPVSIRVPIGLFRHDGQYLAQAFGLFSPKIYTQKTHFDGTIACVGKDYDEATWLVREALVDHLDKGYFEASLEFDSVSYPAEAVPKPSQGLMVDSSDRFSKQVEVWRMLEIMPAYLTSKLIK